MKRITCKESLLVLALLGTTALPLQAELGNGDVLHFGAGSKVSMEVSPGFWIDVPIAADTGLIIGEAQPDRSIDAAFRLFEQPTQHLTGEPVIVFEADASSAVLDFSVWTVFWHGRLVPLGSGGDGEYGEGAALVQCSNVCSKGETFRLDYSASMPAEAGMLVGLAYRLQLVGTIRSYTE
jgi:hypothetical protein